MEIRIKEPRFFLISLDGLLISGLILSIQACKVLNKVVMYSTCLAWIDIVFSTRIRNNSYQHFKLEFLFKNLVICCTTWKVQTAYDNFYPWTLKFLLMKFKQHEIHYTRTIPISASLGFLFRGFKQWNFSINVPIETGSFILVYTVLILNSIWSLVRLLFV